MRENVQRFDAPAADRDIYFVGLTNMTAGQETTYGGSIFAGVYLDLPCTQTTSQILDVYYRLQIPYNVPTEATLATDFSFNEAEAMNWACLLFGEGYKLVESGAPAFTAQSRVNPRKMPYNHALVANAERFMTATWNTPVPDTEFYRQELNYAVTITDSIGYNIGQLNLRGYDAATRGMFQESGYIMNAVESGTLTPIQGIYGHSSASVIPFYDSGNAQSGFATMTIDGSGYLDPDFHKHLRINVKTAGGIGIGEYNFQYRNMIHFNGNTYENLGDMIHAWNCYNQDNYLRGFKFSMSHPNDQVTTYDYRKAPAVIKYSNKEVAMLNETELCIADLQTFEGQTYDIGSIPTLFLSKAAQFFVNSSTQDIWIADRSNGLYKVSMGPYAVANYKDGTTGLDGATGCYGVAEGYNGRIFAYFDGTTPGLYYTDDDGVNWTLSNFSHASITADPTVVRFVKADKAHTDYQVGVFYGVDVDANSKNIFAAWYDVANTVAVGGVAVTSAQIFQVYAGVDSDAAIGNSAFWHHYDNPITYFQWVECSPNQSFWGTCCRRSTYTDTVGSPAKYDFGTNTVTVSSGNDIDAKSPGQTYFGVDENLNDALIYVTAMGQTMNLDANASRNAIAMLRSDMTYDAELYHPAANTSEILSAVLVIIEGMALTYFATTATWYRGFRGVEMFSIHPTTPDGGNFQNEFNPIYGWNVDHWEKYHAGTKPFHATADALIDGITAAFDDASGTTQFDLNDYYTFGVAQDCILCDGATSFNIKPDYYMLPSKRETSAESGILINSTRVLNAWDVIVPTGTDFTDLANLSFTDVGVNLYRPSIGTVGVYDGIGRSATPVIPAGASILANKTTFPGRPVPNLRGYVYFEPDLNGSYLEVEVGLSVVGAIGAAGTRAIDYSIRFDGNLTNPLNTSNVVAEIYHAGVLQATFPIDLDWSSASFRGCRIGVLTDGSIIWEIESRNTGWIQVYESPAATADAGDLYLDTKVAYKNGTGIKNITYTRYAAADYFMYLGNGINEGLFSSDFFYIDPKHTRIFIDGVEAVNIGNNDLTTSLTAGQYSLFPKQGIFRYAAADAGKALTVEYNTVTER